MTASAGGVSLGHADQSAGLPGVGFERADGHCGAQGCMRFAESGAPLKGYIRGCAVGGSRPFRRRYIAAVE